MGVVKEMGRVKELHCGCLRNHNAYGWMYGMYGQIESIYMYIASIIPRPTDKEYAEKRMRRRERARGRSQHNTTAGTASVRWGDRWQVKAEDRRK